jgi:hypothetical protein
VDGITGEEDQERDEEEFTSPMIGHVTRSDIESVAYATSGGFLSREVDFEAEEDEEDESYSCGRPGCPGHVDPPPHTTCIAAIGRDQLTAVVLSVADIERIKESAYQTGREDAARDQEQDRIDEQWSVWLTMPGGITVVTLADEQDDEPLGAVADIRRYDSDEEWARDYAANPPEGTLKAQVRRRTRTHWSAWQPVDQLGVQPTEEQRARNEDQKRDEEER